MPGPGGFIPEFDEFLRWRYMFVNEGLTQNRALPDNRPRPKKEEEFTFY